MAGVLVAAKPVVEVISSPFVGFIIERLETFKFNVCEGSYFWGALYLLACVLYLPDVKLFVFLFLLTYPVDVQEVEFIHSFQVRSLAAAGNITLILITRFFADWVSDFLCKLAI